MSRWDREGRVKEEPPTAHGAADSQRGEEQEQNPLSSTWWGAHSGTSGLGPGASGRLCLHHQAPADG